jgi:hypothetical protein
MAELVKMSQQIGVQHGSVGFDVKGSALVSSIDNLAGREWWNGQAIRWCRTIMPHN